LCRDSHPGRDHLDLAGVAAATFDGQSTASPRRRRTRCRADAPGKLSEPGGQRRSLLADQVVVADVQPLEAVHQRSDDLGISVARLKTPPLQWQSIRRFSRRCPQIRPFTPASTKSMPADLKKPTCRRNVRQRDRWPPPCHGHYRSECTGSISSSSSFGRHHGWRLTDSRKGCRAARPRPYSAPRPAQQRASARRPAQSSRRQKRLARRADQERDPARRPGTGLEGVRSAW